MKRFVVKCLERACNLTHPIVHHRPWLWVGSVCPLALLSDRLDQRWKTGVWQTPAASRIPHPEEK